MAPGAPRQDLQQPLPFVQNKINASASTEEPTADSTETSSLPYTVNVHNPSVSYGGIDPEIEENIQFITDVSDDRLRVPGAQVASKAISAPAKRRLSPSPFRSAKGEKPMSTIMGSAESSCPLLDLPTELIDSIMAYLSPLELVSVSFTCKPLKQSAFSSIHWKRHVLAHLPGNPISSPHPCESWRELYAAHDPHWFLPKYKIWFCDRELTGHIIIVRYDERRGRIEGYRLVATRGESGVEAWMADTDVHIHCFEPKVLLHLCKPVLRLEARRWTKQGQPDDDDDNEKIRRGWRTDHAMPMSCRSDPRHSNILLAKRLDEEDYIQRMENEFPYGNVWPSPCVPATERVIGKPTGLHRLPPPTSEADEKLWSPDTRGDMSEMAFRIRRWMEVPGPFRPTLLGEEISTYSTLDPELYTPTAEKPWRGIWIGDYSGHGCEFLLINQPEVAGESEEQALMRADGETEKEFEERFLRERVHRGRLEAIKLTGDPNVPRGEYTFVADELGPRGYVGDAQQPPFKGARIVKSRGHIAADGFVHDKYMESQLILISPNRLAQHWVGFGHISFFERVDIDKFLVPEVE